MKTSPNMKMRSLNKPPSDNKKFPVVALADLLVFPVDNKGPVTTTKRVNVSPKELNPIMSIPLNGTPTLMKTVASLSVISVRTVASEKRPVVSIVLPVVNTVTSILMAKSVNLLMSLACLVT